ncbi:hypothetical protein [Paraburkholderia sp. BL6665CI2N2]|uniref:hypothetical protein n=1 Tax=Paraburkholderia sp. BL6665CI2N2 TaxID=1938806 RepID=UPI001AB025A1|nr:hypothetical protein [Paraburkholderia sp. BL6665CI2N2]
MNSLRDLTRADAANEANCSDAEVWRWFSSAYEEGRVRWCLSAGLWYVSVDNRHLATEPDFDAAIRAARENALNRAAKCGRRPRPTNKEGVVTIGMGRAREKAAAA